MRGSNIAEYYFTGFHENDFPEIMELWKRTGLGNPERGDTADTIKRCNSLGGKFVSMKLKESDEIIGTSWLSYDGRRTYLHHFGIKPEFQGKGLGNALAIESMKKIREIGAQVKLEVHSSNKKAIRLYKKFGFFDFHDYKTFMIRDISEKMNEEKNED